MNLKAISELNKYKFVIPYQQRGYKWTPDNVRILLNDFKDFIDSKKQLYCLQPVAVVEDKNDKSKITVIDGQQRLTTLYLLWKYLSPNESIYHFEFERDNSNERQTFLEKISNIDKDDDSNIDFFYISRAYLTIKDWFKTNKCEEDFKALLKASHKEKSIQVLWYKVDKDKEHEAFRNINSGKIQLSNSDLIKALLLNNKNGIENHQQIAAQFELMERQLAEDRFWYMLQQKDIEPLKGQSRIDLIFNMVAGIKFDEYQIEPRKSFFKFSDYSTEQLLDMWKNVREKYQRLRDLFDDPYKFHYVGFLTYCNVRLDVILKWYENVSKSEFNTKLKNEIKEKLNLKTLKDYSYDDKKDDLRKIFVLHNIETLLFRYESLKKSKELRFSYENFPFELLYTQRWNIEHIASQTDNNLKTEKDRKDWIDSVATDFPEVFEKKTRPSLKKLRQKAEENLKDDDSFNRLYEMIIKNVEDNPIKEEYKNGIGNLVLLDEHTNKSFHNALFPRKRRIVIMASGLTNKSDTEKVQLVYVPVCTQQVYTKSYNKRSSVNLNSWDKDDYDAYIADIKEKLDYYLTDK
ncbi:MAG: DUF262 domain-containing protein [Salinivirgaceae bacterium]|nr:DUF262 domain-containing protein [Salinivirgaceae bacterium]